MKHLNYILILALFSLNFLNLKAYAQNNEKINWITFNQLNDSLKLNPKKVFVSFYADWCTFCKEMNQSTFIDRKIINILNKDYYAVKMNIESTDTIRFGQQVFINKRIKKLNPIHEIALLLASRKNKIFSLPAMIFFDENFIAKKRYFQFINSNTLVSILSKQD